MFKLLKWWDKCLNANGDYVEEWTLVCSVSRLY
jgi:hypothetical protein